VELRLAHRPLEAEEEAVVEVARVIQAVLVADERVGEGADLEQAVPVGRAAREAADLEAEHDPDLAEADRGDEAREALAVAVGTRAPEIAVDHDDPVGRPAERDRSLAQRVLALGALGVLEHLAERALPDVQVRMTHEVAGADLAVLLRVHGISSLRAPRAISVSTPTSSRPMPGSGPIAWATGRSTRPVGRSGGQAAIHELVLARADGRLPRLMAAWARLDLLILDDLGLQPLTQAQAADLLELIEDRHGRRSTIVTSQLPVGHWHEALGEPTIADAILDRLVHNAYRIELRGESLRRRDTADPIDAAPTSPDDRSP
jgi:IstB-like ATP binding protein